MRKNGTGRPSEGIIHVSEKREGEEGDGSKSKSCWRENQGTAGDRLQFVGKENVRREAGYAQMTPQQDAPVQIKATFGEIWQRRYSYGKGDMNEYKRIRKEIERALNKQNSLTYPLYF